MNVLRIIAVIHGLSLIGGETWRSWGAGRPLVFVVDDYLIGGFVIFGAWLMRVDSLRNRAVFAAAWGANAGMLYGSFFGKLVEPETTNAGNWSIGVLTWLVGLAFAVSVVAMVAAILLPPRTQSLAGPVSTTPPADRL
jgi:vacuolar-type H+-ATPase subunit I/STV1